MTPRRLDRPAQGRSKVRMPRLIDDSVDALVAASTHSPACSLHRCGAAVSHGHQEVHDQLLEEDRRGSLDPFQEVGLDRLANRVESGLQDLFGTRLAVRNSTSMTSWSWRGPGTRETPRAPRPRAVPVAGPLASRNDLRMDRGSVLLGPAPDARSWPVRAVHAAGAHRPGHHKVKGKDRWTWARWRGHLER